jgi:hypothetical protein
MQAIFNVQRGFNELKTENLFFHFSRIKKYLNKIIINYLRILIQFK